MKNVKVYPVILSKEGKGYLVNIPDFDIDTEGESLENAIIMARDAIGVMGIQYVDDGKELPEPFTVKVEATDGEIMTLVDINFSEYRRKHDYRKVKKNCTLPYYLCEMAEKASINFSRLLEEALRQKLGIE